MKKIFYLLPILGLMMACNEEKKQPPQAVEVDKEQTEALEKSIENLDELMESTEFEMERNQAEIDSLLNTL
ncbi:hypothetical protein [uncultured Gelidibacter sp.]|uniref:hypothetical protein n=1 Tax=uncultured Gelidibacter sp. TaxID=259318 RepID=UPI00262ED956|nr:hypothetical protein [uncultured Gelidibacter sp.]